MSDAITPPAPSEKSPSAHLEHAPPAHPERSRGTGFHVAHHFSSAEVQFDANKMGVWLFLVTEVLLFGGMFCAFAVFRSWYFPAFVAGHDLLSKAAGSTNTAVLITSSLTMALAVRSAQMNRKGLTLGFLVATLLFAATFLVIKYFEYHEHWASGELPGALFGHPYMNLKLSNPALAHPLRGESLFFMTYFVMTGIHAVHVLVGMGLITWMLVRTSKGQFSSRYYSPLENVGLYWHLVDIIWIFLFPLLYLIG